MAQASPSTLLYAQALVLLSELQKKYAKNELKTPDELSEGLKDVLTRFNNGAGKAFVTYDPFYLSEPPRSAKINKFWQATQDDINIIQEQIDLLRASTVVTHNYIATEVMKATKENSRVQNKLKTLQLYTTTNDPSLIYFSDAFISEDFIDWARVSDDVRSTVYGPGSMGLAPSSMKNDLLSRAKITLLPTSNGFSGNNQEIQDPSTAPINPLTKEKDYIFVAESNRAAQLKSITDNVPNTWFEYENYRISEADRAKTNGFNLTYRKPKNVTSIDEQVYVQATSSGLIDWSKGPKDDTLKLNLEFDIGKVVNMNFISYTPFGLANNSNNPVKVSQISVSEDGTSWNTLSPKNIWITNGLNNRVATPTDTIFINRAVWNNQNNNVRYIRISIEQPTPITVNVGHLYYVPERDGTINTSSSILAINPEPTGYDSPEAYDTNDQYDDPGNIIITSTAVATFLSTTAQSYDAAKSTRVEGPIPPLDQPGLYYTADKKSVNDLIQKREYFVGNRWAIGIRDITASSVEYKQQSSFISRQFRVPGIVDRVALEADIEVPTNYPSTEAWIKFYVSPDDGNTWVQISRIQDDYLGLPEIVAFNDPTPLDFRESGVSYVDVTSAVDRLRLKVEFLRPSTENNTTPILKSYKLKVKRR